MLSLRPPSFLVIALAACGLMLAALTVLLACQQPRLGLTLAADAQGGAPQVVAVDPHGPARALPVPARITALKTADGRRETLSSADLVEDPDLITTHQAFDLFFERQSRLSALLASPGLVLEWEAAGRYGQLAVRPAVTRTGDLPAPFWVPIAVGFIALVIGAWVWALRPRDSATRLFALAGAAMAICLYPITLYSVREIALPGPLFQLLLNVSVTGAWLLGAALISLFIVYPARLGGRTAIAICFAACLSVPVLRLLRLLPDPILLSQLAAVAAMVALLTVIALQWRAAAHDPRKRAIVRWFGASTALGCGAFVALVNFPALLGIPAVIPQSYAVATFLLIYGGAALGVARYRLFDLDRLAFRILLLLGAAAVVLGLDALLVFGLHIASAPSIGLAFLMVLLLYIPLRDMLWRRFLGRKPLNRIRLFQLATEAAFDNTHRGERWQQLLRQLFAPLEISANDHGAAAPVLREDGIAMNLPAVAGAPGLTIRHPHAGHGLFSPADVQLAAEIMALLETVDQQRDAYERGVLSERLRIARDLHDDVGARLLSALHTAEDGTRQALHAALDDIRSTVAGMNGERRAFGRVIADLRHETARRLEALGIQLDWPTPEDTQADILLSYGAYKSLSSAVRELMSNIMRHAQARHVTVELSCCADRLCATIRDDGNGTGPAETAGRQGNGLRNLTARMELLGGAFSIAFEPAGTSAQFWFPLDGGSDTPGTGVSQPRPLATVKS